MGLHRAAGVHGALLPILFLGTVLAFGCASALAVDRALLMTIGTYQNAPELPGVHHDRANAVRIAQKLGWAGVSTVSLGDAELDAAGIRRSFNRLVDEVVAGDRVFIYYSGHGTSQGVDNHCEQGLLAHDGQAVMASEVSRYLAMLGSKAQQVVVVLDACFSGGIAGGDALRGQASHSAKYSRAVGAPGDSKAFDRCAQPVNFRSLPQTSDRSAVNLERNRVVIAASRDDEVAFDNAETGGLATTALLRCLDTEAAAPASFAALAACAQAGVNRTLPPDPRIRAQTLVLAGNGDLSITAAVAMRPPASDAASRIATTVAAADQSWGVDISASARTLRVGRDVLSLSVTSARDGHLSVFYLGSDGVSLVQLYPDAFGDPTYLRAGTPFAVPRQWRSQGPVGVDRILVVVADRVLSLQDLARLPPQAFGAVIHNVEEVP